MDTPQPTREAVELGFILRHIDGYEFSMDGLGDRLKFQKMVYLMQAFGVYLGYDFSWYLRGPYCTVLTSNGFLLQQVYDRIPSRDVRFDDKKTQKMFEKFLKFARGKSADDLEIAASLHYMRQIRGMPGGEARSRVEDGQAGFDKARVDGVWREMEQCQLISR